MGVATQECRRTGRRRCWPRHWRRWLLIGGIVVVLGLAAWWLTPVAVTHFTTVSTDDAYVNSHVTLVAPRVAGQVKRVLVDDNQRVKAATSRRARPRAVPGAGRPEGGGGRPGEGRPPGGRGRSRAAEATGPRQPWKLQMAIEQVANQVALLRARVAALHEPGGDPGPAGVDFDPGREPPPDRGHPQRGAGPPPAGVPGGRGPGPRGRAAGPPGPRRPRPAARPAGRGRARPRCRRTSSRPSPAVREAPGRRGPDRRPARPPPAASNEHPAAVPRPSSTSTTPRATSIEILERLVTNAPAVQQAAGQAGPGRAATWSRPSSTSATARSGPRSTGSSPGGTSTPGTTSRPASG